LKELRVTRNFVPKATKILILFSFWVAFSFLRVFLPFIYCAIRFHSRFLFLYTCWLGVATYCPDNRGGWQNKEIGIQICFTCNNLSNSTDSYFKYLFVLVIYIQHKLFTTKWILTKTKHTYTAKYVY